MPIYQRVGELPRYKHTAFRAASGELYREELFSTRGFSGIYSTKYHLGPPTAVVSERELPAAQPEPWPQAPLTNWHFRTDELKRGGNFITARTVYLHNGHCQIATARVTEPTDDLYRNAYASEYLFVHHGQGTLLSEFGALAFGEGDQLVVPKGVSYQLRFDGFQDNKLLIVESASPLEIPARYRNDHGQLTEEAPFCERDLRAPVFCEPRRDGQVRLVIKAGERMFEQILQSHPYDVVGWDGCLYPYAFNIRDFQPKVARLHLPPPVHQVFGSQHLVICNFVPRPFDFHPEAVPISYYHSNIDSDEVLYYVAGDFMSRKGVAPGSMTLHPGGIAHGPQPGKIEGSLGAKATEEWAVMIDTFEPLRPTAAVERCLDKNYPRSWLEPAKDSRR